MLQVPVTHKINHLLNFLHPQSSSIAFNLCIWGALFLALLVTFHTILIIKFRQNAPSISIPPLITDNDYSDDEDENETCSLSSTSSEFEEDEKEEVEEEENRAGEFFRVRGSGNGDGGFLRSCRSIGDIFSLSEIANSKSVVKLWDSIGFGLGFGLDDSDSSDDGSIVSVYGGKEKQSMSPAAVVSTGENESENMLLRIWDTRLRRRIPAVIAEWGPGIGKIVGIDTGGVGNVYVRDDGRYELTVGDIRNVRSPLKDVTESQLDLWWPIPTCLKFNS